MSLQLKQRVEEICNNFEFYLEKFDKLDPFTGPSVYFHLKTLETLNVLGTEEALESKSFFEYLYATLASWGMHRMGPKGAKLVDFNIFMKTLQAQKARILELQEIKLTQISEENLNDVINRLWNILDNLKVSATETQLVAGSKVLHHIIPGLMPPIDREHTLRFLYGYPPTYSSDEERFKRTLPCFWEIGSRNKNTIPKWIGRGFHTSETKVIDNAIVGYVKTRMKKVDY